MGEWNVWQQRWNIADWQATNKTAVGVYIRKVSDAFAHYLSVFASLVFIDCLCYIKVSWYAVTHRRPCCRISQSTWKSNELQLLFWYSKRVSLFLSFPSPVSLTLQNHTTPTLYSTYSSRPLYFTLYVCVRSPKLSICWLLLALLFLSCSSGKPIDCADFWLAPGKIFQREKGRFLKKSHFGASSRSFLPDVLPPTPPPLPPSPFFLAIHKHSQTQGTVLHKMTQMGAIADAVLLTFVYRRSFFFFNFSFIFLWSIAWSSFSVEWSREPARFFPLYICEYLGLFCFSFFFYWRIQYVFLYGIV